MTELTALAALALVAAVCLALVLYDVVHYRDESGVKCGAAGGTRPRSQLSAGASPAEALARRPRHELGL